MFLIVIFCLVSDPLLCAARGGATEDVKYEYASAVPDSNDPSELFSPHTSHKESTPNQQLCSVRRARARNS